MKPKTLPKLLIIAALTLLFASAYIAAVPRTTVPGKSHRLATSYKWTGAWQPARVSAADGITALDIKIGKFINLPKEELAQVVFNVNNRFPESQAWSAWAVGDMSGLTPSHQGLTDAQHEAYLTYMDQLIIAA